jgi:hypothetical protein
LNKTKKIKELRERLTAQIEILCALNREVGKNIVELVKLDGA